MRDLESCQILGRIWNTLLYFLNIQRLLAFHQTNILVGIRDNDCQCEQGKRTSCWTADGFYSVLMLDEEKYLKQRNRFYSSGVKNAAVWDVLCNIWSPLSSSLRGTQRHRGESLDYLSENHCWLGNKSFPKKFPETNAVIQY